MKLCLDEIDNNKNDGMKSVIDRPNRSEKILIFGGGSGIGLAIAKKMAECGSEIVIAGRTEGKLKRAVSEVGKSACDYIVADISCVRRHDEYFEEAEQKCGGIDCFINAAAINIPNGEAWDMTEEMWDEIMNINLKGTFFLLRNEIDYFLQNKIKGNILNIASAAAFIDISGMYAYGAAKTALVKWTWALGRRYAKEGIIINAIAPGLTDTAMISDELRCNTGIIDNAIGRLISPSEISELASIMIGETGVILCGNTVLADGGHY